MAIFKRKNRNFGEDLLLAEGADFDRPETQLPKGVGGLLRRTREGYGRGIADVAAVLRIRPEYLEALEHNSVDGLPGPTYATGFVRAYAEYLGLDGVEMVRRFKQEKAGLDTPQALSFPIPAAERGMPGSAMFLTALILAGLGYATYYYMSSGDRSRPPQVEAVPAKLLPPVVPGPDASKSLAETTKPAEPAEGDKTEPAPGQSAPGQSTPGQSTPGQSTLSQSAAAPLIPPPPLAAQPLTTQPGPSAPLPGAPPQAGAPVAAAGPARPTPPARPGELPAVPAPAAVEGAPHSGDAPRVYGNAAGPSRITLRAIADSWVQVRDTDQSLLLTRVLKAGDSYVVPDKPGLSLRTGNAGALAVTVDGKPAPSIGALGVVRKNIALDPAKLSEGTASGE